MDDSKQFSREVGNKIRTARENAGLTQEELADKIGVSRTAISRYESGSIEPRLAKLAELAGQLGVTADYLLGASPQSDLLSEESLILLCKFIDSVKRQK